MVEWLQQKVGICVLHKSVGCFVGEGAWVEKGAVFVDVYAFSVRIFCMCVELLDVSYLLLCQFQRTQLESYFFSLFFSVFFFFTR